MLDQNNIYLLSLAGVALNALGYLAYVGVLTACFQGLTYALAGAARRAPCIEDSFAHPS